MMLFLESDVPAPIFILVLAGIVGAVLALRWFSQKAATGLNRAVHKGQHQAGQKAAGASHLFRPSSVTPDELLAALWQALPYPATESSTSLLNASVYKGGRPDSGRFSVAYGKKYVDLWSATIGLTPDGVGYFVENAKMSDGLVVGAKPLVELEDLVLKTVRRVDPQATIASTSEQVKWK